MEFIENDLIKILLQSAISFIVLFVIAKLLGKKQVSQLTFIDYVVGISMGSIAAEMATDTTRPFYYLILSMAAFGLLDFIVTVISRKTKLLKKVFKGQPLLLIENGKVNYEMLKKSNLDIDDLIAHCRSKGYFYLKDVAYCVFERNGSFSVLPVSQSQEVTAKDLNLPNSTVNLQKEVVIDGKVIDKELNKINKTKDWVFKQLNISNKKQLNNVLLAVYDEESKKLNAYYKNENNLSADKRNVFNTENKNNKNNNKNSNKNNNIQKPNSKKTNKSNSKTNSTNKNKK